MAGNGYGELAAGIRFAVNDLRYRPAAEAARLCGRPQKTVEAQVYRAKKMLAAQLRASGAEAPQKPERRNQNG